MRKFSMLLALLLALTCFALAACGGEDETSSSASSETSSATSGAASSVSSSAASSGTASSVSSEATSETSSETTSNTSSGTSGPVSQTAASREGVEPSGTNLAAGLTLTGADPVDAALGNYSGNLTDGIFLAEGGTFAFTADWLGYWYNVKDTDVESKTNAPGGVAVPTVDFGKATEIQSARIHVMLGNFAGIVVPAEITFSYSEDGVNWVDFGTKAYEVPEANDQSFGWVGFTLEEPAMARYVRVSLKRNDTWTFVDELEVY